MGDIFQPRFYPSDGCLRLRRRCRRRRGLRRCHRRHRRHRRRRRRRLLLKSNLYGYSTNLSLHVKLCTMKVGSSFC